jgi:hypothetical protein
MLLFLGLMTVLAVQGEIEDWKKDRRDEYNLKTVTANSQRSESNEYNELSKQITMLSANEGFSKMEKPSQESLEQLAIELDQGFKSENQSIDNQNQSNQERVQAFTSYCLNLVNAQYVSDTKKNAILTLLSLRLQGHN